MTPKEFETKTGIRYTDGTFDNFVNPLYMAAGQLDKDVFCKEYMHHVSYLQSSKIISSLVSEVETLRASNEALRKQMKKMEDGYGKLTDSMADFLIIQAEKWSAGDLREEAVKMIGIREYLRRKIELGFDFWKVDKDALKEILGQE